MFADIAPYINLENLIAGILALCAAAALLWGAIRLFTKDDDGLD